MKLHQLAIFCALPILAASCHHHWPNEGRVQTIASTATDDTLTCYYDNNGKLVYYTSTDGYKTVYEFRKAKVTESTYGGSHVTMFLNERGLVDSLVDIDSNRVAGHHRNQLHLTREFPFWGVHLLSYDECHLSGKNCVLISRKLTYDNRGYLSSEIMYVNGSPWAVCRHEVAKDDLSAYSLQFSEADTAILIDQVTAEAIYRIERYDPVHTHISYSDAANSLMMHDIFGKCSRHLPARQVSYYSRTDSAVIKYDYTYDKKDRAARLIQTTPAAQDTVIYTYYSY
jgi:hypothetical protein